MQELLNRLRATLKESSDEKTKAGLGRFFKEDVLQYGVGSAALTKIGKTFWSELRDRPKSELFTLFESMLSSNYNEEAMLVGSWAPSLAGQFEADDILVFERWIDTYLNNWAKIDTFCNHTVADLLDRFPDCIATIKSWSHSSNRWMRRASAVTLIIPAKRGEYLPDALEIADTLMMDTDDMVQKGYGWLLKEESRQHQKDIFDYVVRHKAHMPRTALRYAIELMPKELRALAMQK